ncbi:MAG: peptidyl-prolyl cis-trans isomerase [Vicinamibacterales bacterium]
MTMLDRMRRHRGWLKWSLALVVLAFIFLYVPDFLDNNQNAGAAPFDVLASVDGRDITAGEFQRIYRQQIDGYRRSYGANLNDKLLKQLGIDQRILQQMIDEEAALAEADRLGIETTDGELRARILTLPNFQENGRFIGDDRYRQLLRMQRPPIRPDQFEDSLRRDLVVTKLRSALTDWITVSDADADAEFRRRNEKVKLEIVSLGADKFRQGLAATDAEIASHFEANQDGYRLPEKRKVKYLLIDAQALRARVTVTPQDIQDAYRDNAQQYSTPEQIRASHILLKTGEGKPEEDVRKRAEALLVKVKSGADFAALAKANSEDDSNKDKGGDLGFFGKGSMVPEFEQAAFALEPGQVSDIVKTGYGFHVIKLMEKKAASTRTIDEVRTQIEDQIKWERAQEQASRVADEIAGDIDDPTDLDRVAKARGFVVSESGFFDRNEPIAGLGFAPEASADAFEMKQNETRGPIRTPSGFAFIALVGTQEPRLPTLEEAKDRVREDVILKKAVDTARQKAASVSASLKAGDFAKAAKAAGFEVKTTELVARGSALPEVGQSDAVDAAVFALPAGAVSDPIQAEAAIVVARVVEKKEVTPAEVTAGRATMRTELLNERRGRFFASYMTKAKQRMTIRINPETLRRVIA